MSEPPEVPANEADLPPHLKRLRLLVTVLTLTMIAGVITITGLLVIRLSDDRRAIVVDPGVLPVPEGVGTVGYSVVDGRIVLVGDDGVIRVFDSESQEMLQEFTVTDD